MRYDLILGVFIGCISAMTMAETEHEHEGEHREFEAHEHGTAELNWVMEEKKLSLSLHSPAMNMLGFEHKPQNKHENQQLTLLLATLAQPDNLVTLTGGQCALSSTKTVTPFTTKALNDDGEQEHNDIIVAYNFLCQQPLKLESLDLKLFDTFSGFERIHAQWIVDDVQGGATFNRVHHLLKVR